MADGTYKIPSPYNEPIFNYCKDTLEKKTLVAALKKHGP